MDENLGRYQFDAVLSRGEKIFLGIYFPIHVVLLPLALSYFQSSLPFSETDLNLLYYALGAVLMLVLLRGFFRRGFESLCDRLLPCVFSVILGYMVIMVLSYGASLAESLLPTQVDNINNDSVAQLADMDFGKTMAMAVFLAPLVEEPLFRGFAFGAVRPRHRVLAYVLSILLFGLYHVWQYAVAFADPLYLLLLVEYIPAGLALCWVYDRTGSIWTPIFLHMLVNWLNLTALSMMK